MGHCCCRIDYNGPWYLFPPLRNALLAGVLVLIHGILLYVSVIDGWMGLPLFGIAILLGGYHWAREGVEELVQHRRIGIEFLMIAATIGAIALGLFEKRRFWLFSMELQRVLRDIPSPKPTHQSGSFSSLLQKRHG